MKKQINILLLMIIGLAACEKEETPTPNNNKSLKDIPYSPTAYTLPTPYKFGTMNIPTDNPMTQQGVELGRRLFYDPILSADSSQACASCHHQNKAFTDGLSVSFGIDGIAGTRSSMALFNLGYNTRGFFWDGRAETLEIQALEPIENPIEMHDTWDNVEIKLRRHKDYPTYFRKAFGIEYANDLTREHAAKALAQFMRSIVSYQSKFDRALGYVPGIRPILTPSEERGRELFFTETGLYGDAECSHCHGTQLYTDNVFRNNGIDSASNYDDFVDGGRGSITNINSEKGKFRVPSLRNIELTAPYMHDGRFATLEEVLDQYNEHLKTSPNLDGVLGPAVAKGGLGLTQQDKIDLVNFLKTLTDTAFVNNPAFSNPFK